MKRLLELVATITLIAVGVYVASYFACVDEGLITWMGGRFSKMPLYRIGPFPGLHYWSFFDPIHQLDRRFVRPSKWEGKVTWSETIVLPNPSPTIYLPAAKLTANTN